MKEQSTIKVYVIKNAGSIFTAAGNRHTGVTKVLQKFFDVELLECNFQRTSNVAKKAIFGLLNRVRFGLLALKVPKATVNTKELFTRFLLIP